MREGRELLSGGTIEERIPKRAEPVTIGQKMEQVIEDYSIALGCYKEEREETGTYLAMYALDGGILLLKEFVNELKEIQAFAKAVVGEETPPTTEEPEPPPPDDDKPAAIKMYKCRADHVVDEETAKALNFICPKCRMLLSLATVIPDTDEGGVKFVK